VRLQASTPLDANQADAEAEGRAREVPRDEILCARRPAGAQPRGTAPVAAGADQVAVEQGAAGITGGDRAPRLPDLGAVLRAQGLRHRTRASGSWCACRRCQDSVGARRNRTREAVARVACELTATARLKDVRTVSDSTVRRRTHLARIRRAALRSQDSVGTGRCGSHEVIVRVARELAATT
jgi:hypothetical protein